MDLAHILNPAQECNPDVWEFKWTRRMYKTSAIDLQKLLDRRRRNRDIQRRHRALKRAQAAATAGRVLDATAPAFAPLRKLSRLAMFMRSIENGARAGRAGG